MTDTETIEQIIREKIKHGKVALDCIWYLHNRYYRTHGLRPTTVIINETLLEEIKMADGWYVFHPHEVRKEKIFNMNVQVDYDMNDDEIRVARVMAMKINNE